MIRPALNKELGCKKTQTLLGTSITTIVGSLMFSLPVRVLLNSKPSQLRRLGRFC